MSGEITSIADIATGAVIGTAVETELSAGENGKSVVIDAQNCLNCGAHLSTPFCPTCGQKARIHRTLGAFWHDLMHSVFHFDGKILRTLPMLAFKPGYLTRRYVHGERAKFVSPLALFLFTVFLMFAVFNSILPSTDEFNAKVEPAKASAEFDQQRTEIQSDIKELQTKRTAALANNADVEWMDDELARDNETLQRIAEQQKEANASAIASSRMAMEKRLAESRAARIEAEIAAAEKAGKDTASLQEKLDAERISAKAMTKAAEFVQNGPAFSINGKNNSGVGWLDEALDHASENPRLLLYKVQSNAYKYSWALIPLSVPFLWLIFAWRRQYKMFDHAVFVTYSISFMMLLFTISACLLQFDSVAALGGLAIFLIPPVHMYKQIKYAYQTGRFGAAVRTLCLIFVAFTVLGIFASIILALGAI